MTPNEMIPNDVYLGIAIMLVVTLVMRFSGFWLMSFVPITPRVRRMLEALPGSVIMAAVLPAAVKGGPVALAAIGTALVVMIWRRSDFLAVLAGMAVAAALRFYGFS